LPNTDSRLRGPAARTQSICWLAISMMWPVPMTVENTRSPAGDDQSENPAQAIEKMAAPSQVVWVS